LSGDVFQRVGLFDHAARVYRNIVSIHHSEDLFDDLGPSANEWAMAQQVELDTKPPMFESSTPIIDRPFEEALWANAIGWPFMHWQASRFSDGSFGVWYGSQLALTTVFETVHHWVHGLLSDAGFQNESVALQRKIYTVDLHALLVDLRPAIGEFSQIMSATRYTFCQAIGKRLADEGQPGLITDSVRHAGGTNVAVLTPKVLSAPQLAHSVRYALSRGELTVTAGRDDVWIKGKYPGDDVVVPRVS
jgi:hypothetical protein